jgi:indole-3-glycerol phosphate synthase
MPVRPLSDHVSHEHSVELSWSAGADSILQCASILHPDRAVVDFANGTDLDTLIDAGFDQLGPQIVRAR